MEMQRPDQPGETGSATASELSTEVVHDRLREAILRSGRPVATTFPIEDPFYDDLEPDLFRIRLQPGGREQLLGLDPGTPHQLGGVLFALAPQSVELGELSLPDSGQLLGRGLPQPVRLGLGLLGQPVGLPLSSLSDVVRVLPGGR